MKYVFQRNGQTVVAVTGQLKLRVASELKEELQEILSSAEKRVVVDMQDTTYIDSASLGVLKEFRDQLDAQGGKVVVINLQGYCKELFYQLRLDEDFCE